MGCHSRACREAQHPRSAQASNVRSPAAMVSATWRLDGARRASRVARRAGRDPRVPRAAHDGRAHPGAPAAPRKSCSAAAGPNPGSAPTRAPLGASALARRTYGEPRIIGPERRIRAPPDRDPALEERGAAVEVGAVGRIDVAQVRVPPGGDERRLGDNGERELRHGTDDVGRCHRSVLHPVTRHTPDLLPHGKGQQEGGPGHAVHGHRPSGPVGRA